MAASVLYENSDKNSEKPCKLGDAPCVAQCQSFFVVNIVNRVATLVIPLPHPAALAKMWKRSLLYLLLVQLLISPSLPRRGFRGISAARSSFLGDGSRTNYYSGSMSARASRGDHPFRNALLGGAVGAAGGILAFEAGKSLLHTNNGVAAHTSHNRDRRHCSTLMKDHGQHNRTRYVVWVCPMNSYCCGNDCCPTTDSKVTDEDTKRLAVVLGIILVTILAMFVIYCWYSSKQQEIIVLDDPSRYTVSHCSEHPKDDFYKASDGIYRSSHVGAPFPHNGYNSQDPNYYLPGYPPPYPPAYPQCYPYQSPTCRTAPQIPTVHNQQQENPIKPAQA
ncbi:unnamed protein product [Cylicocyclus nassatus]|uniref:CX domain-containing protein n=1 Tax=Cylicocyclus nassatus TaxID=53992 RepID=A0AA36M2R2_CYLNA|nr:unnamed protein product [Cylicocyclus nassatus]